MKKIMFILILATSGLLAKSQITYVNRFLRINANALEFDSLRNGTWRPMANQGWVQGFVAAYTGGFDSLYVAAPLGRSRGPQFDTLNFDASIKAQYDSAYNVIRLGGGGGGGGGNPIELTFGSFSAVSNADVDLTSYLASYQVFDIYYYNLQATSGGSTLKARVSTNGSTFDAAAGNYKWGYSWAFGNSSDGGSGDDGIMIFNNIGATSGQGISGRITIYNPNSASFNPTLKTSFIAPTNNGYYSPFEGGGARMTNQITKKIRLNISAGTLTGSYLIVGTKAL